MSAPHCPPNGLRTPRATTITWALLSPAPITVAHAEAVLGDLRIMTERGLCPCCGYPLDRSEPYPHRREVATNDNDPS